MCQHVSNGVGVCFAFILFLEGAKNPQHSKPPKSWNSSCRNGFLQDWPQHTKVNPSCFCWYSCRQGQEALNAGLAVSSGSLLGWAGYRCLCCLRVTAVVALSHREKKLWGNYSSAQGNQAVSFCLELQCKCVDSPPFFPFTSFPFLSRRCLWREKKCTACSAGFLCSQSKSWSCNLNICLLYFTWRVALGLPVRLL